LPIPDSPFSIPDPTTSPHNGVRKRTREDHGQFGSNSGRAVGAIRELLPDALNRIRHPERAAGRMPKAG
jgi:hypothetical protein